MASAKKPGFKYRGLALIIVNKDFDHGIHRRRGATKDLKMMKNLFLMLDFKVKAYLNLNSTQMLNKIDKAKKWEYDYDPECFVCVVSSHGEEAEEIKRMKQGSAASNTTMWQPNVTGTDGIPIDVDRILKTFSDSNCAAFSGKPKLFFIQACRVRLAPTRKEKEKYDKGLELLIQKLTLKDDKKSCGGAGDSRDCAAGNQPEKDGTTGPEAGDQVDMEDEDIRDLQKLYKSEALSDDEWDDEMSDDNEEDEDGDETFGEESDAGHGHDQAAGSSINKTDVKGQPDAAGRPMRDNMRPVPNEIVAVDVPSNCLLMVPVMSGKYAFRNSKTGSWMLRFMYNNKHVLMDKVPVLQYLTKVCGEIAEYEYKPTEWKDLHPDVVAMLPCKMCACIMHRLTDEIVFEPRENHSLMALLKRKIALTLTEVK